MRIPVKPITESGQADHQSERSDAERNRGVRAGLRSDERERLKALLEREVRKLRRANEILRKASAFLPGRSSTAAREDDVVHRRTSGSIRGRADLCASADRPIDVLRAQEA